MEQRRRAIVSKLDRGYDDLVERKISNDFWGRKSKAWEAELGVLELATKAEILYKSQNPADQRRLLEAVLSNCTFDSGSLCPTYTKPFDLLVKGNETGDWRRERDSNPR